MISFTADIDWAPEDALQDTIDLFKKYNVKCTLFATHDSAILKSAPADLFEIGLHPNFNPLLNGTKESPDKIIDELISFYPDAVGIRSHSLTQNTWLLNKFKEKGMVYDLNNFLPYHQSLKPFKFYNGLLRIPFNWEDDYHFALNYSFDNCRIDLTDKDLNIFNFHPIHIYLNSENGDRFSRIKDDQSNMELLNQNRNIGGTPGTRDILITLLEYVSKYKIETWKMKEIYNKFQSSL